MHPQNYILMNKEKTLNPQKFAPTISNDSTVYSHTIAGAYGTCIMIDLACIHGTTWWGGGLLFCGSAESRCSQHKNIY